jgi:hypothetical protein
MALQVTGIELASVYFESSRGSVFEWASGGRFLTLWDAAMVRPTAEITGVRSCSKRMRYRLTPLSP